MEKFNLERALAGEPVCTRDGREVTQLVKFDTPIPNSIFALVTSLRSTEQNPCKIVHNWYNNGIYSQEKSSDLDLFMKPKENAIWVNVYKTLSKGDLYLGEQFNTEKEAINDAKGELGFVKRLRITDNPDTL
jgi:hypothetical protein